jgi:hypothetical protein
MAAEILQRRKILLWVGAGNSCSAGIPADTDNENGLAYRLALIHYNNDVAQIVASVGQGFRLADLAAVVGKPRIRELILQQAWIDFAVSESHRAIAALVAEGFHVEVVTVNYDPLLEKALSEEGVGPVIIFSAATYHKLTEDAAFVVKIHGCPFRDNDATHLLMLQGELAAPPAWVTTFLTGRLPERVFVYVGFSGNAEYVRQSIRTISIQLDGNVNQAFAVDIVPANEVFTNGNALGTFYSDSGVPAAQYSSAGADSLFREVANIVFRELMLSQLNSAATLAATHGCNDHAWLSEIITVMSYVHVRSFVRKLHSLSDDKPSRINKVVLKRIFKWMLILTCRGLIEKASFRPFLAFPYYPGPLGIAAAPIVFFDGLGQEVTVCCEDIRNLGKQEKFRSEWQIGAEPKWYAVIVNCVGNAQMPELEIIQMEKDSTARGYDPILFVDENTMVSEITNIEALFQ